MKKRFLPLLVLPVFLVGCGQYEDTEVTPLDDSTPVPECVTIEFSTKDEWDGDKQDASAEVYCLKEER